MAAQPKQPPEEKRLIALNLKEEGRLRFDSRNQMMLDMRQRRYQLKPVSIPNAYRATATEVRLSLIGDAIDLMAAIVADSPWRVHVDPYDANTTAKKNSSLRERWSEAGMLQAEKELGRPVLTNVVNNQMGDGVGVLKVIYRPDHWARQLPTTKSMFGKSAVDLDDQEAAQYDKAVEKAKRGAKMPFTLVDVDPMTWLPFYGPDGELAACIELREHRIHEALLRYGDRIAMRNGTLVPIQAMGEPRPYDSYNLGSSSDAGTTVQVWEYWDRHETITFVADIPVSYHKHGMGEVPYFECYAKPSADRDPAINSRPVSYKQIYLADLLDSFYTMMSNVGYQYAYATPVLKTPLGTDVPLDDTGRPEAVEWEQGKLMRLYAGQELDFMGAPVESFKMLDGFIQTTLRLFETSTGLGPALKGIGGSDQPGYAINQLIQASMLSLNPAIKSRDEMLARAIKYIWRLIEKRVKDDVWVWGTNPDPDSNEKKWLKLGPSDIDGYYRCDVESKALLDQKRISMGQFGAAMVKSRLLDRRRVIEDFLGYEDPDSILDDIEVDAMLTEGPLADKMREQLLRRRGMLPAPQVPTMGPEMANGLGAGAPGLPGMPTGLPPAGPGVGMPLEQPIPPNPGQTAGQIADMGSALPPGRAAGADRAGPQFPPADIRP